jgi:hypothetical protein
MAVDPPNLYANDPFLEPPQYQAPPPLPPKQSRLVQSKHTEEVALMRPELDVLFNKATESFALIEPWLHARYVTH